MRIIIVGAGITGLATYLHLRQYLPNFSTHAILIYESHRPRANTSTPSSFADLSTSTVLVGGGLGLSPNGMRVLRELDSDLHAAVQKQGFPTENFVFKGANGWTLGVQSTSDKKVRKVGEEDDVCVGSSRHGVWECLFKAVGEGVVVYKKVLGVGRKENGKGVTVRLLNDDGDEEEDEADLVIGADGAKSVVRTALFDDEKYRPHYLGQSGVGGFLNMPIPSLVEQKKAMVFTFGPNGFFGYSPSSPLSKQSMMWWSTYQTASAPSKEDFDPQAIKVALLERHKHWKDPALHDIIEKAEVQSIYPTWVLPELPHWGEDGIVLVGDAAHAMDPTTGQGASQGLEDAKTLGLLLAKTVSQGEREVTDPAKEKEATALTIKLFHEIRAPRVSAIVERGKKLAGRKNEVGVVGEYVMYWFLWLLMKYPTIGKMTIGDVDRSLYGWSAEEEIQKALKRHGS